jgi:hypothetical protein
MAHGVDVSYGLAIEDYPAASRRECAPYCGSSLASPAENTMTINISDKSFK